MTVRWLWDDCKISVSCLWDDYDILMGWLHYVKSFQDEAFFIILKKRDDCEWARKRVISGLKIGIMIILTTLFRQLQKSAGIIRKKLTKIKNVKLMSINEIENLALKDHQIKLLSDENNKLKVDNKGRVEDTSTVYPSSGREKSDKTSGQ